MIIGFCLGRGANNRGCSVGPIWLKNHRLTQRWQSKWTDVLLDEGNASAIDELARAWPMLAKLVESTIADYGHSVVIGGDHTTAIGTWNGLRNHAGRSGLIWLDAHLDGHTPQTSHTGNLHGMPLAALLGHGDDRLTGRRRCIDPRDVCIIGARDFEPEERAFLVDQGVRVIFDDELRRRSAASVVDEAISIVGSATAAFGVSIDLDLIDPTECPGVGCPADGGISSALLFEMVERIAAAGPTSWEIVEYNPSKDGNDETLRIILGLLDRFSPDRAPVLNDWWARSLRESV